MDTRLHEYYINGCSDPAVNQLDVTNSWFDLCYRSILKHIDFEIIATVKDLKQSRPLPDVKSSNQEINFNGHAYVQIGDSNSQQIHNPVQDTSESIKHLVELKIDAGFEISNGSRVMLKIKVVNIGKRIARIQKVAILGEPTTLFVNGNPNMPLESPAPEFVANQRELIVDIPPDDGIHIWQILVAQRPAYLVHEKDGERYGKGYVELTSEMKHEFEFLLLPDSTWSMPGILAPPAIQAACVGEFMPKVGHKCSRCGFIFLIENPKLKAHERDSRQVVTCPNNNCKQVDQIM